MHHLPPYQPPAEPVVPAFHVARMVLANRTKPVPRDARLRVDLTRVDLPAAIDDNFPLVRSSLALRRESTSMPLMAPGPSGLEVPWVSYPRVPALLVPGPNALEATMQSRWRFEAFYSPSQAGLSFDGDALALASWHAIASVRDLMPLIRTLVRLASLLDIPSQAVQTQVAVARAMRLEAPLEQQLLSDIGPRRPLLYLGCVRWIIAEMCVAHAHSRRLSAPKLTDQARELVRLFFPLSQQGIVSSKEMWRAVWFLHEDFQLGGEGRTPSDGSALSVLSMVAAHSMGVRLFGDIDQRAFRAAEMWRIPDDDPHISQRDVRPSAVRQTFRRKTGLDIDAFLGLCVMETYLRWAAEGRMPEVFTTLRTSLHAPATHTPPTCRTAENVDVAQEVRAGSPRGNAPLRPQLQRVGLRSPLCHRSVPKQASVRPW
jgi:hypothetical protein